MALVGSLHKELAETVSSCRVLVVGAGGIGCELLKNLVLTGFSNIEVIDLDVIDVSNLNRQFLFQKKHVGKSKAQVAKESVLQFCPKANITAYHDSVINPDYNVEFFRNFMLVMNALDNRAARNHVNRMCLAADIPLIESGTAGYLGQVAVIKKLFNDDIKYLLTMDKLWKKRKAPVPLDWNEVQKLEESSDLQVESSTAGLKDQQVLDIKSCSQLFARSVESLRAQLCEKGDGAELVWDKDDPPAMDFVMSASNLRMHIFSMNMKSRFDVKSMAGNIIPAIATTNAVIAGLIVLEGLKILSGNIEQCKTIFLNKQPNPRKKLLVPCALDPPNANCYVCASRPEVTVKLNVHQTLVLSLQDKILKEKFGMVAPDVQIEDGKGTILISSEEGETQGNNSKCLSEFGIRHGSRLQADDFLQDYTLLVNVLHCEDLGKDVEFEVVGDTPGKPIEKTTEEPAKSIANGSDDGAQPSTSKGDCRLFHLTDD
ncbi:SUMO-activating enzyme subunit 2 [Acipenser ruthenus]|uniref:SUMO-activating enzyme subunit 2 n=1 Tax=Acipenser ruthenus TaxID=7906 RepID=A0A444UBL8_ACIRT|nr:SUMO-activating enzyme subunit 2 [Acipenser ruthenus]